jgi:hypothetical protein
MYLFIVKKNIGIFFYVKNYSLQLRRKAARRTMIVHLRQLVLEGNV